MINDTATIRVHCKCGQQFESVNTQIDDDDSEFIVSSLWAMMTIRGKHSAGDGCKEQTKAAWVTWPNNETTHLDMQGNLLDLPAKGTY